MAEVNSPLPQAVASSFTLTLPVLPKRPALRREGSSVHFSDTPLIIQRPTYARKDTEASSPPRDTDTSSTYPPAQRATAPSPRPPKGHIFGYRTGYKPLWLLSAGSLGNAMYGLGTIAIERSIWQRMPFRSPDGTAPPPAPSFKPLFGSIAAGLGIGVTATGLGIALAGTAACLFYRDARHLARRQNTANPNYLRPNLYFAAHLVGMTMSIASQFTKEVLRDTVSRDTTWVAALPGIVGASAFAVTQAQSFSGCEVLNGRMQLRHRAWIGFGARAGVATYTLWAAMMSIPQFSAYGREIARLLSQTSLTLAYSLPLTTARLGRHEGVDFSSHTPEPSWYALRVLGLYICGRVLAGFGPDLLQQGLFRPVDSSGYVFGGASCLAAGTGLCTVALMLFRHDVAAYRPRRADVLTGLAFSALLAVLAYTGIAQYAQQSHKQAVLWAGLVPGMVGAGLRLAILPAMFSYSELYRGDIPLPLRLHWTEGARAIAAICFGMWGTMNAVPDTSSYVRETMAVAAGSFATLGMALPTTTSKRALPQFAWPLSPGATPPAEVDGFTFAEAFGHATPRTPQA